jgi:hypothetical protein
MSETMDTKHAAPDFASLLPAARSFVGEKTWTLDLVLQVGVHLSQAVNKIAGLKGQQKSELVCQTILALLEDVEKADTKRVEESIAKGLTSAPAAPWAELKNQVKNVLPTTLSLVVDAARGKFDLRKSAWRVLALRAVAAVSRLACVKSCVGASVASQVEAAAEKQAEVAAAAAAAEAAPAPAPDISQDAAPQQETQEPPKESQTQAAEEPAQSQPPVA